MYPPKSHMRPANTNSPAESLGDQAQLSCTRTQVGVGWARTTFTSYPPGSTCSRFRPTCRDTGLEGWPLVTGTTSKAPRNISVRRRSSPSRTPAYTSTTVIAEINAVSFSAL